MSQRHHVDRPDIVMVLEDFGLEIRKKHGQDFSHLVSSTSFEGILKEAALYIVVPEISYEYRVISVEILNVAEVRVRFFTLSTNQSAPFDINISNGLALYRAKLKEIGNSVLFRAALDSLKNKAVIKREYKFGPIRNKIIPGQARVAVLLNGEQINAGWIRIEGEYVVYYTGKGLREMWKPNMTPDEHKRANLLKSRTEQELIEAGLVEKKKISEFRDVL